MKPNITVETLRGEAYDIAAPLVEKLLAELGEEGDETGVLNAEKIRKAWRESPVSATIIARNEKNDIVGIVTIVECFAIYANGSYGVINEMFVTPEYRSQNVGAMLIDAVRSYGLKQGWERIDVTAPESDRWIRTREFYERKGFEFTGPKLKLRLT